MSHGAMGVLPKPANQQAVMAVIDSLENTAANDVNDTKISDVNEISLEMIEKVIQQRLSNSVLSAKAEISAGLDGVIHQVLQTQQERLTIAERSLKQQIKPLQIQLSALADDTTLLKRLQPHLQKQIVVIADKVSRKKIDALDKEHLLIIQKIEERQDNLIIEMSNKSQAATLKGIFGGALLGSAIAIIVSFVI
jgi:ribosome-binding ATPase YchF (GTP1/OBG family)